MWHDRCAWIQARLPLMAGDELLGLDRRRVERHLIGCPDCHRRLDALQDTLGILRAASECPPSSSEVPSLWPSLARQIRESNRPVVAPNWEARWAPAWPRVVALSGVVATLLGLLVLARQARGPSDPASGRPSNELVVAPADVERPSVEAAPTILTVESSVRPPASRPKTETVRSRRSGRSTSASIVASKASESSSDDSTPPAGFDYDQENSFPIEGRVATQQSY